MCAFYLTFKHIHTQMNASVSNLRLAQEDLACKLGAVMHQTTCFLFYLLSYKKYGYIVYIVHMQKKCEMPYLASLV